MRATYSPSTFGMHHMSLRQGLRSFSAKRRRTVSRETPSCSVSLTSAPANSTSVQRARPAGGLEQAVATSRARHLAARSWARLFAECRLQVAEHKAALGPVNGGTAHAHAACNLFVAGSGVGRQQNLRPLELARRMLASAQKGRELGALGLAELDPIAYIHPCLLLVRGTDEQLNRMAGLSRDAKTFTPKQGQYLAFIHACTAGRQPKPTCSNTFA